MITDFYIAITGFCIGQSLNGETGNRGTGNVGGISGNGECRGIWGISGNEECRGIWGMSGNIGESLKRGILEI